MTTKTRAWSTSIGAPASLRLPNLLVFGLGGWTWADIESNFRVRDDEGEVIFHNNDDFNVSGLTVGVGLEWKFADWPLSLRTEYRFTDLDNFDNNGRFDLGQWL